MRYLFNFFLGLTLPFIVVSCDKTTTVDGKVLNARTNQPIEGAEVTVSFEYASGPDAIGYASAYLTTDKSGMFHFSMDDVYEMWVGEIKAPGYCYEIEEYSAISVHKCNTPVYSLAPEDAILKVRLENSSGNHDSLFFSIINECDYVFYHYIGRQKAVDYPISQSQNESKLATFNVCRGKKAYLCWEYDSKAYGYPRDSLLIGFEDTTSYTFKY